jgi:hypothetical protein
LPNGVKDHSDPYLPGDSETASKVLAQAESAVQGLIPTSGMLCGPMKEGLVTNTAKFFDTVVLMILENRGWSQVQDCNFVKYFFENGAVFTSWRAVAHPSGPNYRAMLSGNTWSTNEYDGVKRPNLGLYIDYKIYSYRGIPADRHNPFLDMNPHGDPRASNYVGGPLTDNNLTSIVYLGLDDLNNAHAVPSDQPFPPVVDSNVLKAVDEFNNLKTQQRKVFFILFDEAYGKDYTGNHVFVAAIGTGISRRQIYSPVNHYSLAQFMADNWDVKIDEMDHSADTYAGSSIISLT